MLTPQDLDLIKRDTSLRQLGSLLDREKYAPRLACLAQEPNASDIKLTYLRYKPGVNCLAGYEYLVDSETRFAYTKIFSEEQKDKRDKFTAQTGAGSSDEIAFSFFPHDSKLRSLKKIDKGPTEKQFVERVFSDRKDLWEGKIHAIRYKPERRFVARLVLDGQDKAVVKMHTGNSYARLRNSNKAFKSRENLKMARRIGHSDRHRVLAFEWLPGQLLSDMLRVGALSADALVPVGKALANIHDQRADHLPTKNLEMQADHITSVVEQVSFLHPELAQRLTRTASQITSLLLEQPGAYAATHGDFYAKQVLIDGERIGVLDFDESAFDDPMSDLGNFLAHLERDRLRFNLSEDVDVYQEALIEGYIAAGRPICLKRLALFSAANLFKLLPHPFRFREDNWPEHTAILLDKVQDTLRNAQVSKSVASNNANGSGATLTASVNDEALPFLSMALDPQAALPVLSNVLEARYPGYTVESITRAILRRHKPGRRCLIEYHIQLRDLSGGVKSIKLLGKSRRKRLDTSTVELTHALWKGPFNGASADGIYVPEPLGVIPEFNMWLQTKVTGWTAAACLEEPLGTAIPRDMAFAIHKLHTSGPETNRVHTIEDELNILENRLSLVSASHPRWRHRIQDVLAGCKSLAAEAPVAPLQPIHRDFYPDNVLVGEDGIYILDLDLYCMGDPAVDAGNFIGHVMEYSLRKHGDAQHLNAFSRAFEEAFIELAGEQIRPSIHMYTTLTLARHIQISTLFEDRKAFTEALLELCETRLEGVHHFNVQLKIDV